MQRLTNAFNACSVIQLTYVLSGVLEKYAGVI